MEREKEKHTGLNISHKETGNCDKWELSEMVEHVIMKCVKYLKSKGRNGRKNRG